MASSNANGILVVSSDFSLANKLIGEIIEADTEGTQTSATSDIPWKISNKYYDSDVHFSIEAPSVSSPSPDEPAADELVDAHPAVIYVFDSISTTSFGTAFAAFSKSRNDSFEDTEVCMAVYMPKDSASATAAAMQVTKAGSDQNEESPDEFFTERGFEYVSTVQPPASDDDETETDDFDRDIVGISRVREALHAIMWPSMVRKKPPVHLNAASKSGGAMPFIFDNDDDDGGEGLSLNVNDITDDMAQSLFVGLGGDAGVEERQLEQLEKWLDETDDTAWVTMGASITTNLGSAFGVPVAGGDPVMTTGRGSFDDDFTEFVSAQPSASAGIPQKAALNSSKDSSSPSLPELPSSTLTSSTTPDALLPLPSEITSATSRIFSQQAQSIPLRDDIDGDEGDEAFDLNQLLSVLQAMKEEISLIDDVDKRRNAAAAAALGLVKGLGIGGGGGDGDDDVDDGSELGELLTIS
ncbi:hypothetical protein DL93DRAFT_2228742 [Clavulina sp. PMI_390]|nr:hypothetical protein DL93DRAFT_2228742 [Clavulina sp. PMI_390]